VYVDHNGTSNLQKAHSTGVMHKTKYKDIHRSIKVTIQYN